jgi:hypothetical protein
MRRFFGRLVAKRSRGAIAPGAVLVAAALLGVAAVPAGATITPLSSHTDAQLSGAMRLVLNGGTFPISGANFYLNAQQQPTVPPKGNPVAVGDNMASPDPAFPRDGTAYLLLSTGDADQADDADQAGVPFPSSNDIGGAVPGRGTSAFDVTAVQLPFPTVDPASGASRSACVSFDFRFLSEEHPGSADRVPDDAFVAELDSSTWTANPGVAAPTNFASSPNGQPLTIRSGGAPMSPVAAAGTSYAAATGLLHAQVFVPAGQASHSLILSLFDYGDSTRDSAVFLDGFNSTLNVAQASCPTGLTSLGPAPAITGPTISATVESLTPTLTGTASGAPTDGDPRVRIYSGPLVTGTPVQTLTATRSGGTWSVVANPLTPGQYTAQVTQTNAQGINGVSAPTTFTVVAPGSPGSPGSTTQQAQGGASQALPGDKDGDGIPDDQDTSDGSLPPIPGKTFDARVVSGDVFIKYPAGAGPRAVTPPKGFVPLKGAANIPMGSQLDTSGGRVAVTSAADTGTGKTQTADFYDGIFQVKQTLPRKKPAKPAALVTDLVLKGEPSRSECAPLKGSASAAAAKKKKRGAKSVLGSLWGSGKGKFRTNGKYSSATVRGTIWLTQDRCDGTLTTVKRGTVDVRDFKRRTTVSVKAGHSYLARAQRAAAKGKGRTK